MRLPILPLLILLFLNAQIDWYIYRAIARRYRGAMCRIWKNIQLYTAIFFALVLIVLICYPKKTGDDQTLRDLMWILFSYFTVYIPKYLFLIIDLISRIPQLFKHKRIKIISRIGIVLAIFSFFAMWWGALVTSHQTEIKHIDVYISDLPSSFDGVTIAQISDFHTGTYGRDTTFVAKVVRDINNLNPDLIVFTGDIVNRKSSELTPFVSTLSHLSAPMGVYSVLGNHDYGDYMNWLSPEAKAENLQELKNMQTEMGWRMLNNSTYTLKSSEGDSIMLIGVENVGDPPFHTYGDLDAAYPYDLDDENVKILLSHNPAHWVNDIKDSPDKNISLTLSGHTHAMQMNFFGFSPAKFRYPTWGGLFNDNDGHSLYVNTGLGEVGFPARIGATPEITLLTLRKK